jgi:hypothetical protein
MLNILLFRQLLILKDRFEQVFNHVVLHFGREINFRVNRPFSQIFVSAVTATIKAVFSMRKYQAEPQRVLLYLLTE